MITAMIQINSWVRSGCATLGRVGPGKAAGSGWNTGVGLPEAGVGQGARREGATEWKTFKICSELQRDGMGQRAVKWNRGRDDFF